MESTFINYYEPVVPSLKNSAIVTIVTRLLAQPCIKKELLFLLEDQKLEKVPFYDFSKVKATIEKKSPMIPKNLLRQVFFFIKPIALQLLKCFDKREWEFHNLYNHSKHDGSLVWTSDGSIDRILTLKRRILEDDSKIHSSSLFILACKYCYEEYMLELWKNIPIESQIKMCRGQGIQSNLVLYWINTLHCKFPINFEHLILTNDIVLPRWIIRGSLSWGSNILALKHFWITEVQNTTEIHSLMHHVIYSIRRKIGRFSIQSRHMNSDDLTDVLLFLLSQLKHEQKQYFREYAKDILTCLLKCWRWQKYFVPSINAMWDYVSESLYVEIMSDIAAKSKDEILLLKDVWMSSPKPLKVHLVAQATNNLFIIKKLLQVDQGLDVIQITQDIYENGTLKREIYLEIMTEIAVMPCDPLTCSIRIEKIWRQQGKKYFLLRNFENQDIMEKILRLESEEAVIDCLDGVSTEEKTAINNTGVFFSLMLIDRFEFIDKYRRWYFDSDEESNNFVNEQYFALVEKLSHVEEGSSLFRKFLEIFVCSGNKLLGEICYEHVLKIAGKEYFEFATKLLAACYPTMESLVEFKLELMLSSSVTDKFFCILQKPQSPNGVLFEDSDWKELKNIIKWFKPYPKKIVDEVKAELERRFHETEWSNKNEAAKKLKMLYYLLNIFGPAEFLDYYSSEEESNKEESDDEESDDDEFR